MTLNTTINELYAGVTGAIQGTFGSTVFAAPALELVNCLLGSKIVDISTALTWLHKSGFFISSIMPLLIVLSASNAHVSLPLVGNDIFALSNDSSQELVASLDSPSTADAGTTSSIVGALIEDYRNVLVKERVAFLLLLGLYFLVVLLGLLSIAWHELMASRRHSSGSTSSDIRILALEKSATVNALIDHPPKRPRPRIVTHLQGLLADLLRHSWPGYKGGRSAAPGAQTFMVDLHNQRDDTNIYDADRHIDTSQYSRSHPAVDSLSYLKPLSLTNDLDNALRSRNSPKAQKNFQEAIAPQKAAHRSRHSKQSVFEGHQMTPIPSGPELALPTLWRNDSLEALANETTSGAVVYSESFERKPSRRSLDNPFWTPFDAPEEN